MNATKERALAVLIGLGLAVPVAAWLWELRPTPAPLQFVDTRDEQERLLENAEPEGLVAENLAAGRYRYWLDEEQARAFIGGFHRKFLYDEQAYFLPRPFANGEIRWPEHPDGVIDLAAGPEGLREREPVEPGGFDLRILVTGDSHVWGVCDAEETFPFLLEREFQGQFPSERVDVLHAAVGGYGLYNYLGILRKFGELDVDVFCVCVYGGNDFMAMVSPYQALHGVDRERPDAGKGRRMARGQELHPAAMGQAVRSIFQLSDREEIGEQVAGLAADLVGEMAAHAAGLGIEMVVAYLPSALAVDAGHDGERVGRLLAELELEPGAVRAEDRVADAFLAELEERGVARVDLRPPLAGAGGGMFWELDHHLSVRGQEVVAGALREALLEAAGR